MIQKYLLVKRLLLQMFLFFPCFSDAHFVHALMGYVYPQAVFYKVEALCQQLLDDFTVVRNNTMLAEQYLYQTDYLHEQCLTLYNAIETLCGYKDDLYLSEEILYLVDAVGEIHKHYQELCAAFSLQNERPEYSKQVESILTSSREKLAHFLAMNHEVFSIMPTQIDAAD
jgi:hypothetical protein